MKRTDIENLAKMKGGVFVSIYLPTHRSSPKNKQDRIRFKNLLTEVEEGLKQLLDINKTDKFLKEAVELYQNQEFWVRTLDGLAVLISDAGTEVIELEGIVPERVVISDRFHLLPLMNYYEFLNETFILDISKDRFKLFYGDSEGLVEVETPKIVQKFDELFDDKDIQTDLHSTRAAGASFQGHQSKSEIEEKETEKYLRYVAKGLADMLKESDIPVMIFGTIEIVSQFKDIAGTSLKISRTVDKPIDSIHINDLPKLLKDELLPLYISKISTRIEKLNTEIAQGRGSEKIEEIMKESESGRLRSLFINLDLGGMDVLDADKLVQDVMLTDGEVVLVDDKLTDFSAGVAAMYRY